jgi:VanZ family protein
MIKFERLRETRFALTHLLPWLLYCLLIFWFSAQTDPGRLSPVEIPDKIAHLVLYSGFGFLFMRLVAGLEEEEGSVDIVKLLFWSLTAALLYGLSDEFHQLFVPGREFSWMDLLADGAGGYLGARVLVIMKGKEWKQ